MTSKTTDEMAHELFAAVREGDVGKLRELIAAGCDVNAHLDDMDSAGWTALMSATWRGRLQCCDVLLDAGANVNAINSDGMTALDLADSLGRTECAALIRKRSGFWYKLHRLFKWLFP